ncbi:MAG: DUF1302 domain-containing protein [Georgfuchsia sp.]
MFSISKDAARVCCTLAIFALAEPLAYGIDIKFADFDVTTHGGITYGTTIRTKSRDTGLIQSGNASRVDVGGLAAGGSNTDDGGLNFDKGDTVSSVVKAVLGADIMRGQYGFAIRVKAWQESSLGKNNPAFGNITNGYSANRPLRDAGFPERSKFSGAVFQDVYLHGTFAPWNRPFNVRIGNQFLPWGSGWAITGGISALNPVDLPAVRRAGALPEEMLIPIPSLYGKLDVSKNTSFEGFYQFRFRPTEIDGCGTFFSTYDYITRGCNGVVVAPPASTLSDPTLIAAGYIGKRGSSPDVADSGQLGLALTHQFIDLASNIGVYLAEYHSRLPVASAIKTTRAGPYPFLPGDPDGKNALYFTEYPERIRMLGLTFTTKRDDLTVASELTYRPNQPVVFNATELLRPFVSSAPTTLSADVAALPLGGIFHGYDRRKVTQAQIAISDKFHSMLGAEDATLAAEVGLKYMNDLPDQAVRRYGRQDAFGIGPVNGVCDPGSSGMQCSQEGYVSRRAWGYRLKAGLRYPNILDQVDFMPSMTFAHDVRGWSYDNGFNEGRRTLGMSLRATYRKMYFADVTWTPTWGGYFNNARDRSWLAAAAGLRF